LKLRFIGENDTKGTIERNTKLENNIVVGTPFSSISQFVIIINNSGPAKVLVRFKPI